MTFRRFAALISLAAGTFGACRAAPPAVPLGANRGDLAALVGTWEGDYDLPSAGRSGTIRLTIREGRDTAFGDVVMIPRQVMRADAPTAGERGAMTYPAPQALAIRFVRISGGSVSGSMVPYTDPDCRCQVTTSFTGSMDGDRITGTFRTAGSGVESNGTWKVERKSP